jgi:transposase
MATAASVTLGVDTHKDLHVAVTLDQVGRRLGVATFPTDDAHHSRLWDWANGFGPLTLAGVEGTGSFGYRLAQFLTGSGVTVFEVNRPNRVARRRRGKSDPVDAEAAARAVLAGDATATPKRRSGPAGQLRALLVARRSAIKARTQTEQQLRSLILELPDPQRAQVDRRRIADLTAACAALPGADGTSIALRAVACRWQHLEDEVADNNRHVQLIVRQVAPGLLARPRHRPDLRRPAAGHRRRQPRPAPQRGGVRRALRCQPGRAFQRQDPTSPAEPRRRPCRQQRPVDHCHQPADARPANPRLRRPPHRQRVQP